MGMMKFGVGQAIRRVEDQRFVTGHGRYTSDILPEGTMHAVLLRSPHPHATFAITDISAARAMKGVKLILTAADLVGLGDVPCQGHVPNADQTPTAKHDTPLLCAHEVRHIGDAIAFVVADSPERARDAAEAIHVEWKALPAVAETLAAMKKGAPQVWADAPGNIVFDTHIGDEAKVTAAFKAAAHRVKLEIENNRLVTNYMETRGCLATYDARTKSYEVTISSQGVHGLKKTLCGILGVKPDRMRVLTPDVGGGFGTKTFMYREYPLCAEAARRLKRPVRWVADRTEHFVADTHGRDNVTIAELALDAKGRFLAMRFDLMGNLGAYLSQYGPYIHYLGATMLTGVYATPAIFARVRGVFTHTISVDAYRGAGRPEAAYVLERLVDAAARQTGIDPAKLRKLNFVKPSQMPYKTPIGGRRYDTGEFSGHLDKALELADRKGFKAREKASRKAGKLRGFGFATYIECTAWGSGEDVNVRLEADGTVTVLSGTQSNGQGHATAYAQFVSQHLDIPVSQIRVVQGDTQAIATGNGTGGSRSVPVGGVATYLAAQALAENLKKAAADVLEAGAGDMEIAAGAVRIKGTDRKITFADLAGHKKVDPELLKAKGGFVPPDATYPNGTHVVEVEIDPETGVIAIPSYTICDDFGTTVNPLLLAGQVHGGIAQGIGQALLERTAYSEDGQLISASFMDYAMPRADDLPSFDFNTRNVPSTSNPLGIKGAGEAGSIGSCPAVMNAVVDALHRACGITHINMPATPQAVFAAMRAAAKR